MSAAGSNTSYRGNKKAGTERDARPLHRYPRFANQLGANTMVGELFASLSAFKTMFDMAKALRDIHDVTTRDRAVIELQKEILSAQEQQAALIERVRELEKELASFETWDTEKERYEMNALSHGAIAYILKPDTQGTEPSHYICAACYQHRKKSILQLVPSNTARMALGMATMSRYRCPECKSEIGV